MRFGAPAEGKKAEKSADFSRKVVASFFADTSVRRTVKEKVVLLCAYPQPTADEGVRGMASCQVNVSCLPF